MLWNIALKSVLNVFRRKPSLSAPVFCFLCFTSAVSNKLYYTRDEPRMATFKTIPIYRVQYPVLFTFLYLLYFITKPIEFILKCKENELQ